MSLKVRITTHFSNGLLFYGKKGRAKDTSRVLVCSTLQVSCGDLSLKALKSVSVCMCVCVRERESEAGTRQREEDER